LRGVGKREAKQFSGVFDAVGLGSDTVASGNVDPMMTEPVSVAADAVGGVGPRSEADSVASGDVDPMMTGSVSGAADAVDVGSPRKMHN